MFKSISIFVIMVMSLSMLSGCANFLEDYNETITVHQVAPYVRPPTEQISVSDYDELISVIIKHIMELETSLQLIYYPHEGEDVLAEVQRASYEIMNNHPIGAYAVANMTVDANRNVTRFDVDIEIEYKRSKEQLDSIINVSTLRYMMTQILNIMSEYREEAAIRTNMLFTEDDIAEFVKELYYQNPRRVLMLPFVTVEVFPEEGTDRIYEIQFGHVESPSILQLYSENLAFYVRRNAELAVGTRDSEILLSLVNNLLESTTYDEGAARTIHVHGAQNFAATAFGALVRGNAVGEGFAMAFKALCDELGFDSRIVLGEYDGRVHAWNIVLLYGYFYHIDVAMCSVYGIETAFLKTDADFEEMYTWDRENTVRCIGTLTLEDIIGWGDSDITDGPDETDDEPNDDNEEEQS